MTRRQAINRKQAMDRSRGFTIIEVMITLVITSALILGSVNFLVSARRSNTLQSALSDLNSTGRFSIDQVSRDLRMTGYRANDWTLGPLEDPLTATNGASADGGDTISIVYQARRDCAFAQPADADATTGIGTITNVYRVVDGTLQCNGQVITDGVEEMQVYFGEDTDADTVANRWVEPGTATLDMSRAISVRIHMLVRTTGFNVASEAMAFRFDNELRDAIEDGQIRREFSVTVALRNPT
jgi:prepilin-type N-terminal cleavage/methylation domain-containing protein